MRWRRYWERGEYPWRWRLMYLIFDRIRFLLDDFYDPNQEFQCGICNKPVYRFRITCGSKKCDDEAIKQGIA